MDIGAISIFDLDGLYIFKRNRLVGGGFCHLLKYLFREANTLKVLPPNYTYA